MIEQAESWMPGLRGQTGEETEDNLSVAHQLEKLSWAKALSYTVVFLSLLVPWYTHGVEKEIG